MAYSDLDRLRLYLRDRKVPGGASPYFHDDELVQIVSETASVEEAAAMGWLLKAAGASDSPTTITIGQMSETRGQASESFNICMKMHSYWLKKSAPDSGTAKWLRMLPAEGTMVGDLMDSIDAIEAFFDSDFSQLTM